jgi:hypothetical protein
VGGDGHVVVLDVGAAVAAAGLRIADLDPVKACIVSGLMAWVTSAASR